MYKTFICVLTLVTSQTCLSEDTLLDKTELVLAFMIHRHGDRTPVQDTIQFASDQNEVLKETQKYGFGQLTKKGRARGYELGKFIRRRYGGLLSDTYNRSEIYIRSTDSSRTKMTVLAAMAGVYPPEENNWSKDINWTPVPYTTKPAKYDSLLAVVNCPVVINAFKSTLQAPAPRMDKYKELLDKLSEILGVNVSQMPVTLFLIYDMFISQKSLGVPLNPLLEHLLPEIEEGAKEAFDIVIADEKYLALVAGVLLKDFFDAVRDIIGGKDIPRIQVFSAHDINVYTFSVVSKITPRIGIPKYASLFSLEVRRDLETGKYIVVPVYLKEPGVDIEYLQVDGCEGFCDFEKFYDLTSEYIRNETEWRSECGFSEDFDFDTSSID